MLERAPAAVVAFVPPLLIGSVPVRSDIGIAATEVNGFVPLPKM
jgi:hypothetical protein